MNDSDPRTYATNDKEHTAMKTDEQKVDEILQIADQPRGTAALAVAGFYALFIAVLAWQFIAENSPLWLVGVLALIASAAVLGGIFNQRLVMVFTTLWRGMAALATAAGFLILMPIFTAGMTGPTSGPAAQIDRSLSLAQGFTMELMVYAAGGLFLIAAIQAWKRTPPPATAR